MSPHAAPGATLVVSSPRACERASQCEPVTVGVPFPRGRVSDPRRIGCVGSDGADVQIQALPTERWSDGSIRWALIDFQATGPAAAERRYRLDFDRVGGTVHAPRVEVSDCPERIVVDTGAAVFELKPGDRFPFAAVSTGGVEPIAPAGAALVFTDGAGKAWRARVTAVEVEDRGPMRSSVRLEATVGPRRRPLVQVIARVQFFAGSAATRIAVTVRNPRRAGHRGGFWELGDRGSVYFKDASLQVALSNDSVDIKCAADTSADPESVALPFELYQDSSGGENWQHETHVNRDNRVPCSFRGYRMRSGGAERRGLRATPWVAATSSSGAVSIAVEHFWQNFPMAIEADGRRLTLRMWPRQFTDVHELQGGEQKTYRFALAFGTDAMATDAAVWGRMPAVAAADPEWYATCDAIPYLSPASRDRDRRYATLVAAAIEGDDSFSRKAEAIDEYGWRNFGDLYADHENAYSGAADPIVSHYNNQYDAVNGFAAQFMRTGDARWWRLMTELAAHVTDIDIYHTDRDKAAFNNGLFWHTYHYVPAGRCSHRSYPRRDGLSGGGPANEHNYAAGLRLHWLLTGDRLSREAAIGLARWVINMDDGRQTVLRWLAPSHTGLASATHSPDFHGPGRGAGHSIMSLLEGHRLTNEHRFLVKAEALIRRCVHPADDIAALELLDAERRWSYTVFLQALGKYLHYKGERGDIDEPYFYARAALLHYARWMAVHEYPYLHKPAILEYPTETWAAQDMRKCEVFAMAAAYADGSDRQQFLERARFFFDDSLSRLLASETRTLARPVVLLLSNGFMQAGGREAQEPRVALVFNGPFERQPRFVPQKALAKKRLMALGAAAAVLVALVALIAVRILVGNAAPQLSTLTPPRGAVTSSHPTAQPDTASVSDRSRSLTLQRAARP